MTIAPTSVSRAWPRIPEPCRQRAYDILDCVAATDCDTLQQSAGILVACSEELLHFGQCTATFTDRCCHSGDDTCDAANDDICECPGADWDADDCNDTLTYPSDVTDL